MTDFKDHDDDDVEIHFSKKKHSTKKATLFKINGEDTWLPHSQISAVHETEKVVVVSAWIANEKGLI